MQTVFLLIKFGKKEHLQKMLQSGQIRFGLIREFMESNETERGDKFEGAYEIINNGFTEITSQHPTLGTHTFKLDPNLPARLMQTNMDPHCSFSCYALTYEMFCESTVHDIDKRLLEFGEYAIIIKNPREFISRIHKELNNKGFKAEANLIEYLNFNQDGKISPNFFTKSDELKHQNEMRLLIENAEEESVTIEIGSIRDIAVLITAEDVIKNSFTLAQTKKNQAKS